MEESRVQHRGNRVSIVIVSRPAPPPPNELSRVVFWTYCELILGITESDVITEILAAVSAEALTDQEGVIAQRRVVDAQTYERLEPLVLSIGVLMGVASDQGDIDDHFRAAASLGL